MATNSPLGQMLLPMHAITIGRLVTNIKDPNFDYFDAEVEEQPKILTNISTKFYESHKSEAEHRFIAELTHLVSLFRSRKTGILTQISTNRMKEYRLDNASQWFKSILRLKPTQEWILEQLGGNDKIYLVAGYYTFMDAVVKEGGSIARQTLVDGKLPLAQFLAGSAGVVLPGTLADPRLSFENNQNNSTRKSFVANGEQICAVRYYRINYHWFSSKSVDKTFLEKKNVLEWYITKKGREKEKDEAPDFIELELGQDDPESIDQQLKYVSETGETFLL